MLFCPFGAGGQAGMLPWGLLGRPLGLGIFCFSCSFSFSSEFSESRLTETAYSGLAVWVLGWIVGPFDAFSIGVHERALAVSFCWVSGWRLAWRGRWARRQDAVVPCGVLGVTASWRHLGAFVVAGGKPPHVGRRVVEDEEENEEENEDE